METLLNDVAETLAREAEAKAKTDEAAEAATTKSREVAWREYDALARRLHAGKPAKIDTTPHVVAVLKAVGKTSESLAADLAELRRRDEQAAEAAAYPAVALEAARCYMRPVEVELERRLLDQRASRAYGEQQGALDALKGWSSTWAAVVRRLPEDAARAVEDAEQALTAARDALAVRLGDEFRTGHVAPDAAPVAELRAAIETAGVRLVQAVSGALRRIDEGAQIFLPPRVVAEAAPPPEGDRVGGVTFPAPSFAAPLPALGGEAATPRWNMAPGGTPVLKADGTWTTQEVR